MNAAFPSSWFGGQRTAAARNSAYRHVTERDPHDLVLMYSETPLPSPARSFFMRDDIKIGATFPDYELPDHADTPRKLSLLQATIRWCLR